MDFKSVLTDLLGLSGFAAISAGVWLQFGMPFGLIAAGASLVTLAALAGRK